MPTGARPAASEPRRSTATKRSTTACRRTSLAPSAARVFDVDGEPSSIVDCTMALGSVALGYAEPNVTRAVVDAGARSGNVGGTARACASVESPSGCAAHSLRRAGAVPQDGRRGDGCRGAHRAHVHGARPRRRLRLLRLARLGERRRRRRPAGARVDVTRVPFDDIAALERAVSDAGSDARGDRASSRSSSGCRQRVDRARARARDDAGAVLDLRRDQDRLPPQARRLPGARRHRRPISRRSARRWRTDFRSPPSSARATSWTPRGEPGSRRRSRARRRRSPPRAQCSTGTRRPTSARRSATIGARDARRRRARDRRERRRGIDDRRPRPDVADRLRRPATSRRASSSSRRA